VACADFGSAASGTLGASGVNVTLSAVAVGPVSGVCPLPESFVFFGQTFEFSYGPLCQFAGNVQPVVLMLCALAAGLIVVAGIRS